MRTIAIALSLALGSTSCVVVVAGAAAAVGYTRYQENEAYQDYEADLEEVWDAALVALNKLNYGVSTAAPLGPTEGELELEDLWIRAEALPNDTTRVRVRVGTFKTDDNQRRAGLILEEIADEL